MMLDTNREDRTDTYGFRFSDGPYPLLAGLRCVGWEERYSTSYDFQGAIRKDGGYLLQYTIAGYGILQYGNETYRIEPGQAFLVKLPSDHRYFFPEQSPGWEFIFAILAGSEIERCWTDMHRQYGPKITLSAQSSFIQALWDTHHQAHAKLIQDGYQGASIGYRLVMELQRCLKNGSHASDIPEPIQNALTFIQSHFAENYGLEEIAQASGLSKSHLAHLFRKHIGQTPIDYLTRLRIEKAFQLLRMTRLSTAEIARHVGYANGNYFSKVFRKMIGVSPGEFRQRKTMAAIDHMTIR